MKKRSSSLARAFPALLLCLLCLVPTAYADMGPKPETTITVVNAPEEELYLDLLTRGTPTEHPYVSPEEKYDPAILESLRSLERDGWVLAYSTGVSGPPVFGDLRPQEDGTWHFSYHGLPGEFRVAAATADEAKAVSEVYTGHSSAISSMTGSPTRFRRPRPRSCGFSPGWPPPSFPLWSSRV